MQQQLTTDTPTETGWYPTYSTWDENEGMFPGAHYWNGSEWEPITTASITRWSVKFDTEHEARIHADQYDPER
ncbi:MAG TPA: hypothetical protein VL866_24275 [Pyrinomonadaceae bacterium]|nr:hypothetical protein [Pyrinomonadaceae bacterium]